MWLILLLLAAFAAPPASQDRRLEPMPEPEVREDIHALYLPILAAQYPEVEAAADLPPIYGYATPHRRAYQMPYYNWRAIVDDCQNENFWPMVRGQPVDPDMVEACDNGQRWLLLYNEPEFDHFPATPAQAVRFARDWSEKWRGPVACCGNFYGVSGGRDGSQWMETFVAEYVVRYGEPPPIDAVHLHVYAWLSVDVERLQAWRVLADRYGWRIIVSETGIFTSQNYPPDEIAAALPAFLATVEDELQPHVLMWFSDYLQPWALGPGTAWHHFNLTGVDAALTPVGEAWETHTGQRIAGDTLAPQ